MAIFANAQPLIRVLEGSVWSNHKSDLGGETYIGISRKYHPEVSSVWEIIDAEKKTAKNVFQKGAAAFSAHLSNIVELQQQVDIFYIVEFWDKLGLNMYTQTLANKIFEQAIHLGKSKTVRYLQVICNAFNYDAQTGERLFADLDVDGSLGKTPEKSKTATAIVELLRVRVPESRFVSMLNAIQCAHYLDVAATRFGNRVFMDGWINRMHKSETQL